MGGYKTVVVGTDGSDSSLRAVDRAGQLASGADAKVIVATAYFPASEDSRAADLLKDEGYKMAGNAPIYAILREARDRAKAAGATNVEERPIVGAPVDALIDLAEEVHADLLVVELLGKAHRQDDYRAATGAPNHRDVNTVDIAHVGRTAHAELARDCKRQLLQPRRRRQRIA